jgi:DNA-directed RNA polymerase specialized sigma24 family protein
VKSWLARAASSTVLRGEGHTQITRWSRWFRRSSPVPDSEFQSADEPYPNHWRELPEPWRSASAADPDVQARLREGLEKLPPTWRAVVWERDLAGHAGDQVARELGITLEQQRGILTMARASLRAELASLLGHEGRE